MSGVTPLSHVAGTSVCTVFIGALFSISPKDVTRCLYDSSGSRMGLSLKSAPEPLGVQ